MLACPRRRNPRAFLRLTLPQVFAQFHRQAPTPAWRLPGLVAVFSTGCHDRIIGPPARRATRLIALRARKAYGSFRRVRVALSGCARTRCRSSVVEHPLGKGEVECSIHSGSTTRLDKIWCFLQCPTSRLGSSRRNNTTTQHFRSWTFGGLRSPKVLGC